VGTVGEVDGKVKYFISARKYFGTSQEGLSLNYNDSLIYVIDSENMSLDNIAGFENRYWNRSSKHNDFLFAGDHDDWHGYHTPKILNNKAYWGGIANIHPKDESGYKLGFKLIQTDLTTFDSKVFQIYYKDDTIYQNYSKEILAINGFVYLTIHLRNVGGREHPEMLKIDENIFNDLEMEEEYTILDDNQYPLFTIHRELVDDIVDWDNAVTNTNIRNFRSQVLSVNTWSTTCEEDNGWNYLRHYSRLDPVFADKDSTKFQLYRSESGNYVAQPIDTEEVGE
jgi:hypothetical protein